MQKASVWKNSAVYALMLCASECCTEKGHIYACFIINWWCITEATFSKLQWQDMSSWADGGVWAMMKALCVGASNLTLTSRVELAATGRLAVSWQITAELTYHSQADRTHLHWQTTAGWTGSKWGDRLQLSQHVAAEMTSIIWADKLQLTWQLSWRVAIEPSGSSWAELSWADTSQLSCRAGRLN